MKYPNIDAELARNGITKEKLARELGVTRKTLYTWLINGNIPLPALTKMADMFNCTVDYLIGRSSYAH